MVVRSVNSRALSTAPPARWPKLLGQLLVLQELPHGVGAHERQGAERLAAGHDGTIRREPKPTARSSRRCSSSAAAATMSSSATDATSSVRPLAYHARGPGRRIQADRVALAQLAGEGDPLGVDVGDRHGVEDAASPRQVHAAPVGEVRHRHLRDLPQGRLVVERAGQGTRRIRQQPLAQLAHLDLGDVLDDVHHAVDRAAAVAQDADVIDQPALLAGLANDVSLCTRSGGGRPRPPARGRRELLVVGAGLPCSSNMAKRALISPTCAR